MLHKSNYLLTIKRELVEHIKMNGRELVDKFLN